MAELLLWPLAVISVLLVFGYFFSTLLTGLPLRSMVYWLNNWKHDDWRYTARYRDFRYHERCAAIMKREWQKFAWYLPRAIVLLFFTSSLVLGKPSRRYCGSCLRLDVSHPVLRLPLR